MTSLEFVTKYVGTPYEEMNCYEIAKTYYLEVLGIGLKSYVDYTPEERETVRDLIVSNVGEFLKVDEPKEGDIVLAKIRNIESHIMIFIGQGKLIHTSKSTGCIVDRVDRWSKVISGFYRPRGMI